MVDGSAVEIDDPAARAFDGVRAEVALLRRAVEGLAAERAGVDVPDYAPTLAQIAQAVRATSVRLDRMSEAPALAIGPEEMVRQIKTAGDSARRDDQDALARSRTALDQATRQIAGYIVSERKGRDQDRWLAGASVGGLVLGMLLWAALPGWFARNVVPQNWHWPEQRAAQALDLPMWQTGERLMIVSNAVKFRSMVEGSALVQANRDAIARCGKAGARSHVADRCSIKMGSRR